MATTELIRPTSVRAVAFEQASVDAVVAAMTPQLPQDGIASVQPARQTVLRQRLLDGRILSSAVEFLDEDLAGLFLTGLGRCHAVVQAGRTSLADPKRGETTVTLIDPYEIHSTQRPYVSVLVDGQEVTRVEFELDVVFGLLETAVVVRDGAIQAVECIACSVAVTFSLLGWEHPLLKKKLRLPVRLPVWPPMPIPLAGTGPFPPLQQLGAS